MTCFCTFCLYLSQLGYIVDSFTTGNTIIVTYVVIYHTAIYTRKWPCHNSRIYKYIYICIKKTKKIAHSVNSTL